MGEVGKKMCKETWYYGKDCDTAVCTARCFETFHVKSQLLNDSDAARVTFLTF